MRTKKYVINQSPIPWARARLKGQRFFDPQSREKLVFGITIQSQHDNEPIYTKPVTLDVSFYIPMPIYLVNKLKKNPNEQHYASCKPDLDNLCKFLLDTISNGVLLSDDKIVYAITAKKMYDVNPRTEFTITEI